jgi:hypothetical protein
VDRVTHKVIQPVTTMQIYKGAVPFVIIQLVMVGVLIAFPGIVTGALDKKVEVNMDAVNSQMMDALQNEESYGDPDNNPFGEANEPAEAEGAEPAASDAAEGGYGSDDPAKDLLQQSK